MKIVRGSEWIIVQNPTKASEIEPLVAEAEEDIKIVAVLWEAKLAAELGIPMAKELPKSNYLSLFWLDGISMKDVASFMLGKSLEAPSSMPLKLILQETP